MGRMAVGGYVEPNPSSLTNGIRPPPLANLIDAAQSGKRQQFLDARFV
jgi:hypothetical protein